MYPQNDDKVVVGMLLNRKGFVVNDYFCVLRGFLTQQVSREMTADLVQTHISRKGYCLTGVLKRFWL